MRGLDLRAPATARHAKSDHWDAMYDDVALLLGRMRVLAAYIYRRSYKAGSTSAVGGHDARLVGQPRAHARLRRRRLPRADAAVHVDPRRSRRRQRQRARHPPRRFGAVRSVPVPRRRDERARRAAPRAGEPGSHALARRRQGEARRRRPDARSSSPSSSGTPERGQVIPGTATACCASPIRAISRSASSRCRISRRRELPDREDALRSRSPTS
jgi:hypothetical protein